VFGRFWAQIERKSRNGGSGGWRRLGGGAKHGFRVQAHHRSEPACPQAGSPSFVPPPGVPCFGTKLNGLVRRQSRRRLLLCVFRRSTGTKAIEFGSLRTPLRGQNCFSPLPPRHTPFHIKACSLRSQLDGRNQHASSILPNLPANCERKIWPGRGAAKI
jgi:hypothetical protein